MLVCCRPDSAPDSSSGRRSLRNFAGFISKGAKDISEVSWWPSSWRSVTNWVCRKSFSYLKSFSSSVAWNDMFLMFLPMWFHNRTCILIYVDPFWTFLVVSCGTMYLAVLVWWAADDRPTSTSRSDTSWAPTRQRPGTVKGDDGYMLGKNLWSCMVSIVR
jgi:hypothetical protein